MVVYFSSEVHNNTNINYIKGNKMNTSKELLEIYTIFNNGLQSLHVEVVSKLTNLLSEVEPHIVDNIETRLNELKSFDYGVNDEVLVMCVKEDLL